MNRWRINLNGFHQSITITLRVNSGFFELESCDWSAIQSSFLSGMNLDKATR
tara:strand:+ start:387 stop:542 length:156 start_codon:yes stop_codon:yes gene_type:complete